jgi:two-component system sensor histidine kinase UhpB
MSLKLRLLLSIALSLVLALALGGAVITLSARAAVRDEVTTAFQGARDQVHATLAGDVQHTVTMREVIADFNGQRHVQAFLLNEEEHVIVASQLERITGVAPGWFSALIAAPSFSTRIPIPLQGFPCILLLKSDARIETGEIWQLARDAFAAMLLFSAGTLLFVWLIIGRSLRFFRDFESGLQNISERDYEARLVQSGPSEMRTLAEGFNHMAERLSSYRHSNERLEQQILTLQEEERAEIARDLHDEVGPYLFAIQVDADALAKAGESGTRERAGAIREAALHVQRHVKHILRQLKPLSGLDFGLETGIDDLIAFWKKRHPMIRFERDIAPDLDLGRRGEEAAYRIVQESLNNAVRHGRPGQIRVRAWEDGSDVVLSVEDDGSGFDPEAIHAGMGLKGMAERVRALGGRFELENSARGVHVRALLPRAGRREMADA